MFGFHVSREWAAGEKPPLSQQVAAARRFFDAQFRCGAPGQAFAFQVFLAGPRGAKLAIDSREAEGLAAYVQECNKEGRPTWGVAHGTYIDIPWDSGKPNHLWTAKFIRKEVGWARGAGLAGLVIHFGKPNHEQTLEVLPWLIPEGEGARGHDLPPAGHGLVADRKGKIPKPSTPRVIHEGAARVRRRLVDLVQDSERKGAKDVSARTRKRLAELVRTGEGKDAEKGPAAPPGGCYLPSVASRRPLPFPEGHSRNELPPLRARLGAEPRPTSAACVRMYLEVPHVLPAHSHYESPAKLIEFFRSVRARVDPDLAFFGLCIDTAHLWASGADISSYKKASAWLDQLEEGHSVIPPHAILLHLNDNKNGLGGGLDAHEVLLRGKIWGGYAHTPEQSGLAAFVDYAVRHGVPTILERKADKGQHAISLKEALRDDLTTLAGLLCA